MEHHQPFCEHAVQCASDSSSEHILTATGGSQTAGCNRARDAARADSDPRRPEGPRGAATPRQEAANMKPRRSERLRGAIDNSTTANPRQEAEKTENEQKKI